MAWFIPVAVAALSATATMRGARANANALEGQARVATSQAGRDEEAQRREGRQVIGAQAAGMAQAGAGLDEGLLRQSAVAAELDALNIRYAGAMKASGLLVEAKSIRKTSPLLAGAQLLSGGSQAYTQRQISNA